MNSSSQLQKVTLPPTRIRTRILVSLSLYISYRCASESALLLGVWCLIYGSQCIFNGAMKKKKTRNRNENENEKNAIARVCSWILIIINEAISHHKASYVKEVFLLYDWIILCFKCISLFAKPVITIWFIGYFQLGFLLRPIDVSTLNDWFRN